MNEQALVHQALGALSEGVVLLGPDLELLFANDAGTRLIRLADPTGQADPQPAGLLALPGEGGAALTRAIERRQEGHERVPLSSEGHTTWWEIGVHPLGGQGQHLLVIARDVTAAVGASASDEERAAQVAQAARMAALGEIIAGVAHEVNNPLTVILGYADLLASMPGAEAMAEELGVIAREARRARDVIRDLTFLARPGDAAMTEVPVEAVFAHVQRLRRISWQRQGIEAAVHLESVPGTVRGNEHQLTQLLLNLVTNAEEATEGVASRQLTLRARPAGAEVVLEVADNGRGMDAATRDRCFEPFFTTRVGQGTGLGLSMASTIATAHAGRIEVDSAPGMGSTFRLYLPAATPHAPAAVPSAPAAGVRVLVVDDEPSVRAVCQRLIQSMGHRCEAAADSASAALAAADGGFDIVICDYRLATETADNVLAALLRVAPTLVPRTVIATGAINDAGVESLAERHGLRVVAKPYGYTEIERLIAGMAHRN